MKIIIPTGRGDVYVILESSKEITLYEEAKKETGTSNAEEIYTRFNEKMTKDIDDMMNAFMEKPKN
jgi:hypothetical protein